MKLFKTRIRKVTEVITYFIMAEDEEEALIKIKNKEYPILTEKDINSIEFYEVKNGIDYTSESLLPDH